MGAQVVSLPDGSEPALPFTEVGKAVNSASEVTGLDINGLDTKAASDKVGRRTYLFCIH